MKKKDIQFYQKKFDELVEGFENGSIEAYEMCNEICRNCQNFIDAGVDVKRISKSYLDTYEGFYLDDCEYGYYVDDYKLDKLTLAKYIIENKVCGDACDTNFWMDFCDNLSEEGVSNDLIRQLLRKLDIYRDIFFFNKIDWLKRYDDDLEPYISIFVKNDLGDDCLIRDSCKEFIKLPEEIRSQILIKWLHDEMSNHELADQIMGYYESFEAFLEETGLDVDFLIEKFVREDGYIESLDDWQAVELFLLAPDKIDSKSVVQKIVEISEEIRRDDFFGKLYCNDYRLKDHHNTLREAGADEAIIAPLLTLIKN